MRSEDTLHRLMITVDSLDPKSKEDKFKQFAKIIILINFLNKHTQHTFWNSLISCANTKWIQQVLLKIQSGHDSVHRRTEGQGEISIPPFQLVEAKGIKMTTRRFALSSAFIRIIERRETNETRPYILTKFLNDWTRGSIYVWAQPMRDDVTS